MRCATTACGDSGQGNEDGSERRGERIQLRNALERPVQLFEHPRRGVAQLVLGGRTGRQSLGQHRMNLRRCRAEPLGLTGEVAPHLIGVQVALANRSRTLVSASFQPSVPVLRNWEQTANVVGWPCSSPSDPSRPGRPTWLLPASASTRVSSRSGLTPGGHRRNAFQDVGVAVDEAGIRLVGAHRKSGQVLQLARSAALQVAGATRVANQVVDHRGASGSCSAS